MAKKIVICCDGTNNKFQVTNTNVVKLYQMLPGSTDEQITYYHPGVGTLGASSALTRFTKWWTQVFGSAFGFGIMDNISNAYAFLMDNYEDGDKVFIFGFSRGAYTARAIAGMLHMFGLIRKGNEALIPYVTDMMKHLNEDAFDIAPHFKSTFSRECKPHFVGVWDTVSSVGWLYDPVKLPYSANNPDIQVGRHAISIDERRCMFKQNLWGAPKPGQDIKQVWFAGVHCDVGGGYAEKESGLSKIALEWMVNEAQEAGLILNSEKVSAILGADPEYASPRPDAPIHKSLEGFWWILEFWLKPYKDMNFQPPKEKWGFGMGKRRFIREGATLHETVLLRKQSDAEYRPGNLPKQYEVEPWKRGKGKAVP